MVMLTRISSITSVAGTRIGGKLPTSTDVFCAFPGVDLTTSQNRTPGGASFTVKGTGPTYTSQYAQVDPANTLTMGAMGATAHTFMMIFRRVLSGSGAGTRLINTAPSSTILWQISPTTGLHTFSGVVTGDTTAATLATAGSLDDWRFCAAQLGTGEETKVWDFTSGTSSTDGGSGTPSGSASNSIDICGGPSGTNTRPIQICFIAHATSYLSEAAMEEYYDWSKGIVSRLRGISC